MSQNTRLYTRYFFKSQKWKHTHFKKASRVSFIQNLVTLHMLLNQKHRKAIEKYAHSESSLSLFLFSFVPQESHD